MRVLVDLKSLVTTSPQAPVIVQVERTPVIGEKIPINGRFALPIVKGVDFPILGPSAADPSYVLDVTGDIDGGDVSSISYAYLLAMYPNMGHVYFNPLLTDSHVEEIDFTALFRDTFSDPPNIIMRSPRLQTGRPTSDLTQLGQMPTHTALLSMNASFFPLTPTAAILNGNRPGLLITKEIDISAFTIDSLGNPVGADEFLVYWKLYDFDVTHDVAWSGINEPATRSLMECDQEPDGFTAYVSPDNGVTWCQIGLLEPVAFCNKTTKIRLAFMNTSSSKRYIATYAVLF